MDNRNNARLRDRLLTSLRALLASLQPSVGDVKGLRYCCGVNVEPRRPAGDMPTPGSCCGVRV